MAKLAKPIKRTWKLWKVPIVVGAVLLVIWSARGPVLKLAAGYRATRAIATAETLAEEGRWKQAEAEARRAIQLDRNRIAALRVLLASAFQNRSEDALRIAAAVFSHPESTESDKAQSIEYLLLSRDYLGASRLLSSLSPEQRSHPDLFLQATRFLSLRGGTTQALRQLEEYLDGKEWEDPRFSLLLADLHIRAKQFAQARSVLSDLVKKRDETSLAAFRMLTRVPFPELAPLQLEEAADWIEQNPKANSRDQLLLSSIRLARATSDEAREEIITRRIAELRDQDPAGLGDWLFSIGEGARVESLIDEEKGKASASLCNLRLRSLLLRKDYEAAALWLRTAGSAMDSTRTVAMQAMVARQLGQKAESLTYWRSAMHEASIRANGNLFLSLSALALDFLQWDWAIEAMLEASRFPETLLPPATDLTLLIDYLLKQDRAPEAAELTYYWLAREPENPSLRNNLLYIRMLSGDPLENSIDQSDALRRLYPGMIGFHTTHALALALHGQVREGAGIVGNPSLDWSRASESDLAIRDTLRSIASGSSAALNAERLSRLYPAERRILLARPLPDFTPVVEEDTGGEPSRPSEPEQGKE